MVSVRFVISHVLLALVLPVTVFLVLSVKPFIMEDVGPDAQLSWSQAQDQEAHKSAVKTVLMDSTRSQSQNVLHALLNVPHAPTLQQTAPPVFKAQSLLLVLAVFDAAKTNSASVVSVLPAQNHAMDARLLLKTV